MAAWHVGVGRCVACADLIHYTRRVSSVDLSHIIAPLRPLAVEIATLSPDPDNARLHGDENISAIKASLKSNGQYLPIVVQAEGSIVRVGNGRLRAAKELGWTHIAAAVVPMDQVAAVKLALADNRTSELAEWDFEVLSTLLQGLHDNEGDHSILELGWSSHELEPLLNSDWAPPQIDDSAEFDQSDGAKTKKKDKAVAADSRVLVCSLEQWAQLANALGISEDVDNDTAIDRLLAALGVDE